MKSLEDRWEGMVGRLGSESFPDFLRIQWNSRKAVVRQTELFKVIRGQVQNREQAFTLIREMEEDIDTYLAITEPENSGWGPEVKRLAAALKTFHVRQPYALLLAARRKFNDADFESILRACVIASLRWNVVANLGVSEQGSTYSQTAIAISKDELVTAPKVVAALAPIYLSDSTFTGAFSEKSIRTTDARNRRVVRYILCAIEKHVSGADHDFASQSFNIEHILPQSSESGWDRFSDEQAEAMVYRLGNMTLMATGPNSDCGNEPFAAKKPSYANSIFEITKKIAEENDDWSAERIGARQDWLAKQATALWRIPQLS
jgi:hypothetical protein